MFFFILDVCKETKINFNTNFVWNLFNLNILSNNLNNNNLKYCVKTTEELREYICKIFNTNLLTIYKSNNLINNEIKLLNNNIKIDFLQFFNSSAFLILFYYLRCKNNNKIKQFNNKLNLQNNNNLCNCLLNLNNNKLNEQNKFFSINEWLRIIQIFIEHRQSTKILDNDVYQVKFILILYLN